MTAPTVDRPFDQAEHEAEIVRAIQSRFRTFGDQPAQFAAGVDVAQVVRFVLTAHHAFLGTNDDT